MLIKKNLNINELTSVYNETEKLDLVESTNIYLPFKGDAIIPKDLTYSYTNTNTINSDSEDKILSNYIIEYTNGSDRNIKILYSYNTNFSNDYLYDIDSKITTINGIDLKIYKYKYMYFIKFNYNNYNFYIETSNITLEELSKFLVSILK